LTNVDVRHDDLVDLVGKSLSIEEFVDRITFMGAGPEGVQGDVMTFDIFPNRPDLYSVEGIARGLRGFLGMEVGLPVYQAEASGMDFVVDRNVADVRPYAVGGIVRGLELEDALLRSLVDLQEKLHLTVGRRRKKVAIGIHDMDKVTPPYTYKAVLPPDVRFTPLGMAQEMDLLDILTKHEKGREYAHLVASQPVFPIITDARGQVLSFPPVINGILTQLTPDTRNLFIDVTGTDLEAVSGCLAILSTALAERAHMLGAREVRIVPSGVSSPETVGPSENPPHVLFVGRLSIEKGILEFLQATDGMPRVIVGDGPLRDRVPEAVGFVRPAGLGPYYERAAVVACPSRREGYGVVAREAMAHGRPVVASAVGGLVDAVGRAGSAHLVPPLAASWASRLSVASEWHGR